MHDNRITGYTVNTDEQTLTVHTYCHLRERRVDMRFSGVLTHSFENIQHSNIIADVCERSISEFVDDNLDLLLELQSYGWPVVYRTMSQLEEQLADAKYRYIVINSSLGLFGWVLAMDYRVKVFPTKGSIQ